MQATKQQEQPKLLHNVQLTNRNELFLTGIIEVISATENSIIAKTSFGPIVATGTGLKIKNLNNETHELLATGEINEIKYSKGKKGLIKKLFK